ncbi:UPF0102 protein Flav2ADRAFT_0897 [Elysia marginata]|uniref:UPF0102 protein Flav2ADRAFT_0897 n=1 Tax=Elysia marginata TaxID=1093978 RepID=A0AAV4G830_9GAST|nr:UPF0102 protein Flav2ADRAFT_0897 [Elysia marginata]
MADSNTFGKQSENMAVQFLKEKSYRVLKRNYRYRKAEIDILALKGDTLAVVEVKARSYTYYGEPEMAITKKKIRLLTEAANHFVNQNNLSYEVQFDVIAIKKRDDKWIINHIERAFYPW